MKGQWRNRAVTGLAVLFFGVSVLATQTPSESEKSDKSQSNASDAAPAQRNPSPERSSTIQPRPTAEDIMKAFSKDRPMNKPVSSLSPSRLLPSDDPDGASLLLLREGEFINRSIGRLEQVGPWWTLVFESDSKATPRPPMRLLPNRQLERMVRETNASSGAALYEVSGEVTLFDSQNYLLMRKSMRFRTTANLDK